MASAALLLSQLLLVAVGSVVVSAVGGPPPSDDQLHGYVYMPSRHAPQVPLETLKALDKLWDLPFFQDGGDLKSAQRVVNMDDLDKVSGHMHPPLEFSIPERFRQPDDVYLKSNMRPGAAAAAGDQLDEAESAGDSSTRRILDWLPESVQKWVPKLPSLPSLPSYIPGVNFEAELHRNPVHIPSPADLKLYVNVLVDKAMDTLHRKQLQLAELIKCSCPRPARCNGILEEFLGTGINKPSSASSAPSAAVLGATTSPASSPAAGPAFVEGDSSSDVPPHLSLYAGLTKPSGEGPGLGFYVDQSGPHFGHYVHPQHPTASSSAGQSASAAQAHAVTASSAAPLAAPAAVASKPSRPSSSSQAAAYSQSHASGSGTSASAAASASASASASAHRHSQDQVAASPHSTEYTETYGAPAPAPPRPSEYDGPYNDLYSGPPSGDRAPAPPQPQPTEFSPPAGSGPPPEPSYGPPSPLPTNDQPFEPFTPSQPDPQTALRSRLNEKTE